MAVLGGLIAAVIGELFAVPLLNQLNVPDDVFPLALLYLRIYLAGLPVILLYNFEAAVFRSVGETKIPLIALTASGVLNVILNLFFVAALHMSVDGVAIATVLSNAVSAAILWGFLLKTDKVIRLEPKKLRIDGLCLKQILRIGVPAGVQSAMFSIANIVIQGAINSLGTVVMAASSAAYNIEVITYDILNSFSQACTTFVGQNFGAGEIKRCKKTLLLCLLEGIISLGVAIALILFFGKSLLTIFNGDPQVVETGYIRLMLIMPSHLFSLCYEVLSGYLRGFEIAVKESAPLALMTSYNKLNGTYSGCRHDLITDILRCEWGYKGLVMTDWGTQYDPAAALHTQVDMMMPGADADRDAVLTGLTDGSITPAEVRRAAARVLTLIEQSLTAKL